MEKVKNKYMVIWSHGNGEMGRQPTASIASVGYIVKELLKMGYTHIEVKPA